MLRRTSIRFRWFLLASFFVVTVVGIAWPRLPYKTEVVQICPISGSILREVVWFGFSREQTVESTALEEWIRDREPDFAPQFEPWCQYRTFLFSVRRTCSKSPSIFLLRSVQDRLVADLSESRIKDLIRILRSAEPKQKREFVETVLDEIPE